MMKLVKYIFSIISVLVSFQLLAADGVARATFTTDINEHEPMDEVTELTNNINKIYYFTEIKGLEGQTLTHRWELNGEIQASVSIPIGGDRWRIWSSKNLPSNATGEWRVMVLDEAGGELSQDSFNYVAANTESSEDMTADSIPDNETQQTTQTIEGMKEEDLHKIAPSAGGNTISDVQDTDMSE